MAQSDVRRERRVVIRANVPAEVRDLCERLPQRNVESVASMIAVFNGNTRLAEEHLADNLPSPGNLNFKQSMAKRKMLAGSPKTAAKEGAVKQETSTRHGAATLLVSSTPESSKKTRRGPLSSVARRKADRKRAIESPCVTPETDECAEVRRRDDENDPHDGQQLATPLTTTTVRPSPNRGATAAAAPVAPISAGSKQLHRHLHPPVAAAHQSHLFRRRHESRMLAAANALSLAEQIRRLQHEVRRANEGIAVAKTEIFAVHEQLRRMSEQDAQVHAREPSSFALRRSSARPGHAPDDGPAWNLSVLVELVVAMVRIIFLPLAMLFGIAAGSWNLSSSPMHTPAGVVTPTTTSHGASRMSERFKSLTYLSFVRRLCEDEFKNKNDVD